MTFAIMRIISFCLAVLLSSSLAFAQNSHLEFDGLQLDGSLYQFAAQLEAKGYVVSSADFSSGNAVLSGDYAGFENAVIIVSANAHDKVGMVTAMVQQKSLNYSELYQSAFVKLRSSIQSVMGEPVRESGDLVGKPKEVKTRLKAGQGPTVEFKNDAGSVILTMSYQALTGYFILAIYSDAQNQVSAESLSAF